MMRWNEGIAFVGLLAVTFAVSDSKAALCSKWSPAVEIGRLDPSKIDESSGLAVSRKYDVLYHNNDSGTGPFFWVSARDGSDAKPVKIKDYVPKDPEEIAVGPCPGREAKSCVVLADIGDNLSRRKNVALFFMEELEKWPSEVAPAAIARFRYSDGPRDAEAVAVMPNGDVVVVSKEGSLLKPNRPAGVYRTRASEVSRATKGEEVVLERVGTIDVPTLAKDRGGGGIVTAMSVTSDGKRFVLLTYTKAFEFEVDLSSESLPKDFVSSSRVVGITKLQGQESVTYDRNDKDVLYSTEQVAQVFGKDHVVPLMKASCLE